MKLLPFIFSIAMLMSCNADENALLNKVENTLPGVWMIESIQVNPSTVINHFGEFIYNDTTLYDIGVIHIPDLSIDSLKLGDALRPVPLDLITANETVKLQIDRLFLTADKSYFMYLRPGDTTTWASPSGVFLNSTRLFNRNHVVLIQSEDHIELETANGNFERITLRRG